MKAIWWSELFQMWMKVLIDLWCYIQQKLLFMIGQGCILKQTILLDSYLTEGLDTEVKGIPVSPCCADDGRYADILKGRDSLDIRRRCQSSVYCKVAVFSSWKRAMQSRPFCRVPGRAGPWELGRISPDGEGAMYESWVPQGHGKASHWVWMEEQVLWCYWNTWLFKVLQ